ncbi:hypothetical protein BJI67_14015 [Acidihalobacter aeolianus]|uniref:Uncharacterized protein n=1 Tax=Acidihalobacter aeolianus TaxID=2792603 RepID=A0A1D8KAN5_9GAMM|nr:hypothetical protein [Acidihalobacter aeolianus]AOV18029.1 hypothetical protein BJI67_14015 [Acidihalobacter aeolianus]
MLTPKGQDEILKLVESDLVQGWDEADRTLRNVVRMLLCQRLDLLRLYFLPAAWQRITTLERRLAANVILAAMQTAVVTANGAPPVTHWAQARFYLSTRSRRYADMARDWCAQHPEACPERYRTPPQRNRLAGPDA